ncbi:phospholipase D-like domain-containing protein [Novosphingobium sp.]|uniref:phospholipase D-like domain-containing protein n=1 Tax=Novosphingobium sp. TaxID=1874826 RepID=UPI003B525053
MRNQAKQSGLIGQATAGTYVVILGWDIDDPALRTGLLGFAIKRSDKTEGEDYWLRGMKTFPGSSPLPPGGTATSLDQPYQTFQWGDYTAKPGHEYIYSIVPMHGQPGALTPGAALDIDIRTEAEDDGIHSVYFNRGAIASQEYARRFQNKAPNVVGQAAYDWLSRGLIEAIEGFIAKATGPSFALRVAIYEFQWPAILDALKQAEARGVDVKVIFDAIDNAKQDPVAANEEAIGAAGIDSFCQGFTQGKIMHNKFIVLSEAGAPVAVLSGSTNYTENGIFGHLNCAHIVRDQAVAQTYLDFWEELQKDPPLNEMRDWVDGKTPTPPDPLPAGILEVFSPQHGTATLQRYADIAAKAGRGLFMTFAFGMNKDFVPVYSQRDDVLRFALMDSVGVGKNKAQAQQTIDAIRALPNAVVAIGQNITMNEFDRWLKERDGLAAHENVRWVHTKFMLVDPLSENPLIITGSANFSDASVESNHENMLIIADKRAADIYLGEFMRQFSSYAFRDAAASAAASDPANFKPQDLIPDESWLKRYYPDPGAAQTAASLRRLYFSGQ